MKLFVVSLIMVFGSCFHLMGQKGDSGSDYESAIKLANNLYKEGKYLESIVYYKEALAANPSQNLPKYRIEDIKTIYIKKEIAEYFKEDESALSKKEKRELAEKKLQFELSMRQQLEEEIQKMDNSEVRTLALNKISQLKEGEVLRLNQLRQEEAQKEKVEREKRIEEAKEKARQEEERKERENAEKQEEAVRVEKERAAEQILIEEEEKRVAKIKAEAVERARKESALVTPHEEVIIIQKEASISENVEQPPVRQPLPVDKISEEKNDTRTIEELRMEELRHYMELYPNPRTVETKNESGKVITRIILNHKTYISIFTKVQHSWGGLFFFKQDHPSDEPESISQQYFERQTQE